MATTQEFLRSFWNPLVQLLPDVKDVKSFNGWSKHNSAEVIFNINKDEPYGMFFTPNGNYWSLQKEWEKIHRSKTLPGATPLYNALVVDVDLNKAKNCKTKEQLKAYIDYTITSYWIAPTYIVETWWWFHIYWVIRESDRQAIHDTFGAKVFDVSLYMCSLFDWWDENCQASKVINWLVRLPWANHWKTGKPKEVKIVYENLEDQLSLGQIEFALKQIQETTKSATVNKDLTVVMGAETNILINKIPFDQILTKLSKYPRLWNGNVQTYVLEWSDICIVDWEGTVNRTDWYKLRREKNCINCFTKNYHPIEERPMGAVFPFLFHYFNKNMALMKNFLSVEFWIDFGDDKKEATEIVKQTLSWWDYYVEMTNRRVILHKDHQQWKKIIQVHVDIFRKPFEIIGKSWVKFHANGTETEDEQMVYIIKVANEYKVLYRLPTKKRFNEKYSWYLWYYWDDNDLWLFYEAIDKTEVPTIHVTSLNWIYSDCVILWWNVLYWENKERFITPSFQFETVHKEEISIIKFYNKLCEIYLPEIALPILLQTVAMAWMNVWWWATVYPAILVTGRTWSGKSSIAEIMKNALWYSPNGRKVALPQITPQPLKVMATDNSILRLDELTAHVNEKVEESIRNIINKDKWWRGIWAENAYYNFRSPLFFTGERTFKDESLNNRMVAIVISESHRVKWWFEKINDIKDYSIIKNVYDLYFWYKGNLKHTRKEWAYKLAKKWISSRNADVWAYMFAINEAFELWFAEELLFALAKKHLDNMWFWQQESQTDEWEFQMYLSRMVFTRQVQCIQERYKNKRIIRFIFMDESSYQKARWTFTQLVNWFNEHWQRISISKSWISMTIMDIEAQPIDFVLDRIADFVLSCNYKAIQYVDRGDEKNTTEGY